MNFKKEKKTFCQIQLKSHKVAPIEFKNKRKFKFHKQKNIERV